MFGQSQIIFLGHMIFSRDACVEKEKIDAVLNWPTPTNVKELQGFVRGYGMLARPSTDLTKKNAFKWSKTV